MKIHLPSNILTRGLVPLAAFLISALLPGGADTVIEVSDTVVRPQVQRFGIGLAQHNYYDSNQMMKELLFRNPGFEGQLFQSVVRLGPGGTADSVIEDQAFTQWPSGFWAGASYAIIWSSGNAKGRAGLISNSLAPFRTGTPNDPSGSPQGTTYQFTDSDPLHVPQEGDYMVLRKAENGGSGGGAAYSSWQVGASGGGVVATELADLPPGTLGQQCLRLEALTTGQQAGVTGQFDTLSGFIRLQGQFRLAFRAKGIGGANRLLISVRRGNLTPYLQQTVQLNTEWTDYAIPFPQIINEPETVSGTVSVQVQASGQSAALVDDVSLRQTDGSALNPTEFRDAVVETLQGLRPGILRYVNWQAEGDSLANSLAPVFGRRRSGYSSYSTIENNMMPGLHEFLALCEHLGADPWYSMPVPLSTQEAAQLMEYLGGEVSTPFGAIRSARGHPLPWTDVFARIYLEFGNENWNNSAFRGAAITQPVPCGNRASEIFGVLKSSPYYRPEQVRCILGGQTGNANLNTQLHNASSLHDRFTLAPYMASRVDNFANNEELFGPLFAEPEWWSFHPSPTSGLMRLTLNNLQASPRPVPLCIYEVNLHTTQGAINQATLDTFTSSIGAAVAVADHMLVMLKELDCREQVFFSLAGHRYTLADGRTAPLWGSVLDMGKTNRRRPQYFAMQLLNSGLAGDLLSTTHSGENPTWSVNNLNRVTYAGAHALQSFAFRDGARRALFLFNLHRTSPLEVRFAGPNAPSGSISLRRLTSANLTDNNEASEAVTPTTQQLSSFDPASPLSLPPFSMSLVEWTPAPRQSWRYQHFGTVSGSGLAADLADPDGDSLSNLMEYALGTAPTQPTAAPWQSSTEKTGLTFSVPKNPTAAGLTWVAETSSDLIHWSTDQATIVTNDANNFAARTTPLSISAARVFLRIRVVADE